MSNEPSKGFQSLNQNCLPAALIVIITLSVLNGMSEAIILCSLSSTSLGLSLFALPGAPSRGGSPELLSISSASSFDVSVRLLAFAADAESLYASLSGGLGTAFEG